MLTFATVTAVFRDILFQTARQQVSRAKANGFTTCLKTVCYAAKTKAHLF